MEQRLGLFSATAIVVGSMIGSGIFIVPAEISRGVGSPALLIGAWLVTAVMTMIGALSYGELAAMMPRAGGQYVYLREALGPMWGFLFGWTLFLVIQTGTIAAVAVAFGKFLGVFFPSISSTHWLLHLGHVPALKIGPVVLGNMELGVNTANLTGVAIVLLLTAVNILGVKLGALVQNVFTTAKTAALLGLVIAGFLFGRNPAAMAANFGRNFWQNASWHSLHAIHSGLGGSVVLVGMLSILAVVQTGSLFSADAWNNVTYTAGEIRNPRRNLPVSLVLGTSIVLGIYILANFVYLLALPLHGDPHGATAFARGIQYASEDRVATVVLQQIFHSSGAYLMAAAILISTFGCANGLIMAGARVYYAMSRDGLFFASAAKLHPKFKTPVAALLVQAAWTCLLCFSGSYSQLLDYIICAELIFYILTIASLFVLRARRPEAERPYRAIGYPVLPAVYILMAAWICVVLLRYKPEYTWPGIFIVLLGVPVFLLWSRRQPGASA
ncbi:APC family permease [Acidipila rosea]|uniref:Amino acid/polyamine/organocation transporter (APC superfamily) n=1 Tax=Acidipila rosea TaxID=768535 RepID=A0A4R1L9N4_9BACT|nr:amino acid permease [Acidipila rosea]TCK74067.1 amino acid/polyamine/organocation transporter (APC superfamily) [Acidipila rosea]